MKIVTEIHFESEEEREIFMQSPKLFNALKEIRKELADHAKYDSEVMAAHYLGILDNILFKNSLDKFI